MSQFPETSYMCRSTGLPLEVSTCIPSACAYTSVSRQETSNGSVHLQGGISFPSVFPLATNEHYEKDVPGDGPEGERGVLTPNSINSNVQFSKFSAGTKMRV